jgi:hypothetical protein
MRSRLPRWLLAIVPICCCVQGCAWCVFRRQCIPTLRRQWKGGVLLLVTSRDALPSASAFRLRPPWGRLRWSSSRLPPGGCAPAPLSFRWSPWDPGGG